MNNYSIHLILSAAALMAFSAVPGLFGNRRSPIGQHIATALMTLGGISGLLGVALSAGSSSPAALCIPWSLPWGRFHVVLDALSAFFLVPVLIVPVLGSWYGMEYWKQSRNPLTGRGLRFFYGILAGSMILVVIARDSVLFLIVWEIMAVAAYFLAATESEKEPVRRAAWVYLVCAHIGTVFLMALFCALYRATGSFDIAVPGVLSPRWASALFLLAVIGFGFKAGIMPLHVWLPGAHANAPSHVSAVLSGVMLKMGIYGMFRMASILPAPEIWWGASLLGIGAVTGVLGIAFAIAQSDLKRLLAYSSIENIGIITMGLGFALLGRSLHQPAFIALGLGGALLHVWNHSLFKSLLFLNSGAIIHSVHTRQMDRMGGLAKAMPRTAFLFCLGAVAICGLPPLNGFAGEWLIYQGLFRGIEPAYAPVALAAGLGAVSLAMIGALAVACFVKLYGIVFLGLPRTDAGAHAHDPGRCMIVPMALLGLACLSLGLLPQLAAPMLGGALTAWNVSSSAGLIQFTGISLAGLLLLAAAAAVFLLMRSRTAAPRAVGTWGCGYVRPSPRIQYTSSSFGQMIVNLFSWALFPRQTAPRLTGPFPARSSLSLEVPDTVLDRAVLPVIRLSTRFLPWVRLLQQGRLHIYLLYIFIMIIVLFFWKIIGNHPS